MTLYINGEKIEDEIVKQEAERLRPEYERTFAGMEPEQREAQLIEWSKENVIERVLLSQHAKADPEPVAQEDIESQLASIKQQAKEEITPEIEKAIGKQVEARLRTERLFNKINQTVGEPKKEEIKKFYEEHKQHFVTPEQIHVAHIVKHINWQSDENTAHQQILEIKEKLDHGTPFEGIASEVSDCPDSGGDLGYIQRGQMVEEFEDVAFNLAKNQISDCFRTRFGYHIVKLYDRKPQTTLTLKEKDVYKFIADELKKQIQQKALEDFLDKLKEQAKIEEK